MLAGVSRAAVSKWFRCKMGPVNVESRTILNLAKGLNVAPDLFLRESADLSTLQSQFLWDFLYPSMKNFIQALIQSRLPALARLVQVLGFHNATVVAGKKVVRLFEKYKKFVKPVRRRELEILWPLYISKI